jgi:hypothetical protein
MYTVYTKWKNWLLRVIWNVTPSIMFSESNDWNLRCCIVRQMHVVRSSFQGSSIGRIRYVEGNDHVGFITPTWRTELDDMSMMCKTQYRTFSLCLILNSKLVNWSFKYTRQRGTFHWMLMFKSYTCGLKARNGMRSAHRARQLSVR